LPTRRYGVESYAHPPDLHPFPTRRSSDLPQVRPADGLHCHRPRTRGDEEPPTRVGGFFVLLGGSGNGRRQRRGRLGVHGRRVAVDRKSTRLNSSHVKISYAVFCLKKKRP